MLLSHEFLFDLILQPLVLDLTKQRQQITCTTSESHNKADAIALLWQCFQCDYVQNKSNNMAGLGI